jgi:diaminopimelate epimerase
LQLFKKNLKMNIQFSKYQGTGNDFVIIDNRDGSISLSNQQIAFLCDRRFGVGGDGLMLLGTAAGYDFSMTYYNADGTEGTMCGNGGRCLVQFAHDNGIVKDNYLFIAVDGPHEATISNNGWVYLKMSDVHSVETGDHFFVTNTGSPHYVKVVEGVEKLDVFTEGKAIRYNDRFKSTGINVNFVEFQQEHLFVRTYERGVENETYSCGTGVTAAAITTHLHKTGEHIVSIKTLGGALAVRFNNLGGGHFNHIWLQGPGTFVYKANIHLK